MKKLQIIVALTAALSGSLAIGAPSNSDLGGYVGPNPITVPSGVLFCRTAKDLMTVIEDFHDLGIHTSSDKPGENKKIKAQIKKMETDGTCLLFNRSVKVRVLGGTIEGVYSHKLHIGIGMLEVYKIRYKGHVYWLPNKPIGM